MFGFKTSDNEDFCQFSEVENTLICTTINLRNKHSLKFYKLAIKQVPKRICFVNLNP